MMIWIRVALLCLLVPLSQAQKDCMREIRWGDLLEDLNSLSNSISIECGVHYDSVSLCDPQEMLKMVEFNAVLLAKIMEKAATTYEKHEKSHKFVDGLVHAHNTLDCAHHLLDTTLEPVNLCFEKLDTFLEEKRNHSQCAWEIVTAKMREILQRLERRAVMRH